MRAFIITLRTYNKPDDKKIYCFKCYDNVWLQLIVSIISIVNGKFYLTAPIDL
jgi:hypothetical protein